MVLCVDAINRLPIFAELDHNHLPIALMIAKAEEVKKVVIGPQPVLKPPVSALIYRAPVDTVLNVGVRLECGSIAFIAFALNEAITF
jgi:hypothetical protein